MTRSVVVKKFKISVIYSPHDRQNEIAKINPMSSREKTKGPKTLCRGEINPRLDGTASR